MITNVSFDVEQLIFRKPEGTYQEANCYPIAMKIVRYKSIEM